MSKNKSNQHANWDSHQTDTYKIVKIMNQNKVLVINKQEWERLRKQAHLSKLPHLRNHEREDACLKISQKWIQSWPDTKEGHLIQALKKRERKRIEKVDALINFAAKQKENIDRKTTEAITKAKQMIFNQSGHGRELLSALIESKTLEERDEQIKRQKVIEQKTKDIYGKEELYFCLDENDKERENIRKKIDKECADVNKKIITKKQEKIEQAKILEQQLAIEDAQFMNMLLKYEKDTEEYCKISNIEAMKECEDQQKKIRERRLRREEYEEAVANVWLRYHDRVRCKEQKVFNQIHKDRYNTPLATTNFDIVKKLQEEENSRYESFIKKGIDSSEANARKLEQEEVLKSKFDKEQKILTAKSQLNPYKCYEAEASLDRSKCECWRQSLFTKGKNDHRVEDRRDTSSKSMAFPAPRNTLIKELRQRELQPSPWSGTQAAQEYFTQQATDTLNNCRYKTFARRVIRNYRKNYNLDTVTLPEPEN